jgi:tetratricopeptide (TPR) repeat protein
MMSNARPLARAAMMFLLALPASVLAGPKEDAQAHIVKATEAHQRSDFNVALQELEAAYAIDPQPDLLYAIGQVYVKLERCADAISYYERYLATAPTLEAAGQAQEAIDACKAKLPAPEPQPAPTPLPPPSPPTTSAWYKDPIGGALVGGGLVAGALGVVFYLGARNELDEAEAAMTLPAYEDHVDSAHSKRLVSVILFGGGAALIAGGIARYVMHDAGATEARRVGVVPTSGGGLLTLTGEF